MTDQPEAGADAPKKKLNLQSLNKQVTEQAAQVDDRLEALEGMTVDIQSSIAQVLKAVNNPRSITRDGPGSETHYQHDDEVYRDGVPQDIDMLRPGLSSVNAPEFKEKAEQMEFDREPIQIMVHLSQAQFPDNTFTVGVNGRLRMVVRGIKMWLPRNYVEVLARAKMSTYGNVEIINERGEREIKNDETKSHRYPFQVIKDESPFAGQWLERVLNDRAA